MSKVGKYPVSIPKGVSVSVKDHLITIKGASGQHSVSCPEVLNIDLQEECIALTPCDKTPKTRALWGTLRSLLAHKVQGFVQPFEQVIDLVGVGYKAAVQGKTLKMQLGYSHDVDYVIPEKVNIRCDKPTQITVSSFDKEQVGRVVSQLVAFRPPEPYKGKGLIRVGRPVFRKEGKKK